MKDALTILTIFLTLIYLPLAWYMGYLVYNHIHATELMWFLFWINIPFSLISTIVGKMVEKLNK